MGPAQVAHVEEVWSYFCVSGVAVGWGWDWESLAMPGRAGSLQTSCLGTETALAPGDSAWNQPGEAESAPCIQDFPEAGLSLVLRGV